MKSGRRAICLLAIVSTVFLLFVWFLLVPSKTDPYWWLSVGHLRTLSPQARKDQAQLARRVIQNVKNGRDYFADYSIDEIRVDLNDARPQHFRYIDPATSPVPAVYLSAKPKVLLVPEFLTDEECEQLIDLARPAMSRSKVVPFKDDENKEPVQEVRTSTQTWLGIHSTPTRQIVERILNLTGMPPSSAEPMQILRYEKGQKYDAHHDYLHPSLYGKQDTSRAVTVFLYLSDVAKGGETQFPRADGKPQTNDLTSCTRGLRVRPKKRALAVFYDMKPDGQYDEYSIHGGCPVADGVKWGGTLWLNIPVV